MLLLAIHDLHGGEDEQDRRIPVQPAPEAPWPEFEGVALRPGEIALIGRTATGAPITERFKPGAIVTPPDDVVPLLNRAHDRGAVAGHVTGVHEEAGEVRVRGIVVDTVPDGHALVELARSGSVGRLSIEFVPLGPANTTITPTPGGGQLIEHSRVLFVGLATVSAGAYRSARLTSLLDRAEAGKQREAMRQRHLDQLHQAQRRAKAIDVRADAIAVPARSRRKSA